VSRANQLARRTAVVAAAAVAWLAAVDATLADSPAPSQASIGDPRAGQTAEIIGNPVFAVVVVALIALVAVAATLAWVRATSGAADPDGSG
jgi:hypothetical protein